MSTKSMIIGLVILVIIVLAIVLLSKPGNKAVDMNDDYTAPTTTQTNDSTTPAGQYQAVEPGATTDTEAEVALPTTGVEEGK